MIPLGDDVPKRRQPAATLGLLVAMGAAWVLVQGAGLDPQALAASVCNYGLVPGELSGAAPIGTAVPMGNGLVCAVDADPINWITPLTSMFLHGGWMHLLGNALFFWVFGRGVEDAMGRSRFVWFYLCCGLIAAAGQVFGDPASPVPMVGASGAISGVMGAYLVLHPEARVRMLFIFIIFFKVFRVPAWIVLLYWFAMQLLAALPQLAGQGEASSGVAVLAHVAGFLAGVLLVRGFAGDEFARRSRFGSS